jgi:hypothetical protein
MRPSWLMYPRVFRIVAFVSGVATFLLMSVGGVANMGDPGPGDPYEVPQITYVCIKLAWATASIAVLAVAWATWLVISQHLARNQKE